MIVFFLRIVNDRECTYVITPLYSLCPRKKFMSLKASWYGLGKRLDSSPISLESNDSQAQGWYPPHNLAARFDRGGQTCRSNIRWYVASAIKLRKLNRKKGVTDPHAPADCDLFPFQQNELTSYQLIYYEYFFFCRRNLKKIFLLLFVCSFLSSRKFYFSLETGV